MSKKILVSAEYFEGFRCLAGDCQYSCCRDWRVDINKSAYSKLRSMRMSPALREQVDKDLIRSRKSLNNALYAQMRMKKDGRCSFLTEDGLCSLQAECGPGILPSVCRTFPRDVYRIGDLVERACTMGCEEIVNRLWELPHSLEFICEPMETVLFTSIIRDTDNRPVIFRRFLEVQTVCVDLLQNPAYHLDQRILILGMALRELAELEHTDEDSQLDPWLEKWAQLSQGDVLRESLEKLPRETLMFLMNNVTTVSSMGVCSIEEATLQARLMVLSGFKNIGGTQRELNSANYLAGLPRLEEIALPLENIMVNDWFRSYAPLRSEHGIWWQYVRFCNLYSLLKFFLATLMTNEITQADMVHTVVLWARQLEHNTQKLNEIVDRQVANESDTLAHMAILIRG